MADTWGSDDLARLMALEHAFGALALIGAANFAHNAGVTPLEAVGQIRQAIESAPYDAADTPDAVRALMRAHLKRLFDHVETMAAQV